MRRGDFEALVQRHFDDQLVPRGFTLTPQPPADWDDEQPDAVLEARPDDFNRRYPALAAPDEPFCIDLWVELDPRTGTVTGTLNGYSVTQLAARLGRTRAAASGRPASSLELQLADLSTRFAELLDAAQRLLLPERLRDRVRSFGEISAANRAGLVDW